MSNVGDSSYHWSLGDGRWNRSQNGLTSSPAFSFGGFGSGYHLSPSQTGPTTMPPSSSWPFGGGFGGGHHPSPSQTGPTTLPPSSSWPFGGGFGSGHHPSPSQIEPTTLPRPFGGGFGHHASPSQTGPTTFPPSASSPFGGGSGFGHHPSPSQTGPTTFPPYSSWLFGVGSGNNPNPSQTGPPSFSLAGSLPNNTFSPINNNSSFFQSPVQGSVSNDDFEDAISSMTADKASILRHIKLVQPWCLSSLRLRSKPHREAAYNHLAQAIQDLKVADDGNCGLDFYDKVMDSLFDLEIFYGFSTSWLRHEVVQLQKSRMLINSEKETKRQDLMMKRMALDNTRKHFMKQSKHFMKQMEEIDAELAKDEPPPPAPVFRY